MFITGLCDIFLVKRRWPKNKSLYEAQQNKESFFKRSKNKSN